ncbi:MAG: hypothetical protein AAGC56_12705 [Pseudomonadota bacterium]
MTRRRPVKARRPRAAPPGPSQVFEARIETIGAKGDGVAAGPDGPVFVPYTAPGDLVRVEAVGERGDMVALLEPGPDRAAPPCPHYGACGGCALQHLTADAYRALKRDALRAALAAAGLDPPLAPFLALPPGERRRATFHVRRRAGATGATPAMGFYARRSRRVVESWPCLVLHPDFARAEAPLRALAAAAPAAWDAFSMAVTRFDAGFDVDLRSTRPLAEPGPAEIAALAEAAPAANVQRLSIAGDPLVTFAAPTVRFDGLAVAPPPGGFLQASERADAALLAAVRDGLGAARRVADLFSGCGTFALPLARARRVDAFDSDGPAIDALAAAASAVPGRLTARRRDLFDRPLGADELAAYNAVVLDPPRAGAPAQVKAIAAAGDRAPARLVYVSCNPKSFARDARILVDSGYALTHAAPVDQFVYAAHLEVVAAFVRG